MQNSFDSNLITGLSDPNPGRYEPLPEFLEYAWTGNIDRLREILKRKFGQDALLATDYLTGMNALHIAVGRNNLEIVKLLVEAGIKFIPDYEGRMPSLVAAICQVDEALADYIAEAEATALTGQGEVVVGQRVHDTC